MDQAPEPVTDNLTPEQRKHTMSRVKGKDTGPEMQVRRWVHKMGYRYRLHRKDLPGNPDLVFPAHHKIIFIHGCFWHGHDCKAGRKQPKTHSDYWTAKLARNKSRDAANQRLLTEQGWRVLVVWECELKRADELMNRLNDFLQAGTESEAHA